MTLCANAAQAIRFHTDAPGFVSLNIYRADGTVIRQLLGGAPFAAGDHTAAWDGLAGRKAARPGLYSWRAVFREALVLKLRGWIGDFDGDGAPPSAVSADGSQVYLGWSGASGEADAIVACDPAGTVRWTHHRGPLSGCRGLSVDGGKVFVLGGQGPDAVGRAIYRLSAATGAVVPWPDGRIDLPIESLWPAKGNYKPDRAEYLAVKNGRIYLSFNTGQFIAVLDAKTGAYLQTIVGGSPGPIDSVATKSDTPANPDSLVDADFVVTSLNGASIGKLLLAHDPIWVLASELTQLDYGQSISALTIIGDGAKHHMHDIFVGLGGPWNQVQGRSALDTDTVSYVAGTAGGRFPHGIWQPDRLGDIRAITLDGTGQLWVAEGDTSPGRISVWTTDTSHGRLTREWFSPPDPGSPVAVDPLDSRIIFAGGCEWRIDPATGRAAPLDVVSLEPLRAARFVVEKDNRLLLVLTPVVGPVFVLERVADGDYRPRPGPGPGVKPGIRIFSAPPAGWRLTTADGFDLGAILDPTIGGSRGASRPTLTETADGEAFITVSGARIWDFQLSGLETVRPLASGTISLPSTQHPPASARSPH